MKDQGLTMADAASWLRCTEAAIQEHLDAGRLARYVPPRATEAAGGKVLVSLNSVVVLGESLPADLGIFEIRDRPASADRGYGSGGYGAGGGSSGDRSAPFVRGNVRDGLRSGQGPIVERRPLSRPRPGS